MSSLYGIRKTQIYAQYLRELLSAELGDGRDVDRPECPLEFLEELNFSVKLIAKAIRNKRKMTWSVNDYLTSLREKGKRCSGMQPEIEGCLQTEFPPNETESISAPCVIVDSNDIVLFWFLPSLLERKRQLATWKSLEIIEERLAIKDGGSWRTSGDYYLAPADCTYRPGTLSFGLAWYQQAMKGTLDMEVSAELRKPTGYAWVSAMETTNTLLGAVLGVIHPPTFNAGVQCIQGIEQSPEIGKRENLDDLLKVWTSPCIAGSIINNRNTPLHRDNGASYGSMDILASVGSFYDGRFWVPSLGYEFLFTSGSVFGMLGRILPHGAKVRGERLCIANYLRENIFSTLGVDEPELINIQSIVTQ